MRKVFTLSAIIAVCGAFAFFSQSCSKIIPPQDVSWSGIDDTLKVPIVSDTVMHLGIGTSSFSYNIDSLIKNKTNNAFSANNIAKVTLKSVKLTIVNPDNQNNWANYKFSALYFNSSVNMTQVLAANVPNNPDVYSDTLSLPVDNTIDLKSYLYSSSYSGPVKISYVFGGQLRRPTTKILTVAAHVEYDIKVSL
jgi:hypothetical protein